jgi:integrase
MKLPKRPTLLRRMRDARVRELPADGGPARHGRSMSPRTLRRRSKHRSRNIADVDLTTNVVRVAGKGKKRRVIPLGPGAVKTILHFLDLRRNDPRNANFDAEALLINKHGQRLEHTVYYTHRDTGDTAHISVEDDGQDIVKDLYLAYGTDEKVGIAISEEWRYDPNDPNTQLGHNLGLHGAGL